MRKILLFAIILVTAYLIGSLALFFWRLNVGKRLAREAQPFERIVPDAPTRILHIGDSTVVGTGSSDPTKTVTGLLAEAYPNAHIINRGKNGRKTESIARALEEFPDNSFDLIVLHTGANDILRFTPLDELEQQLRGAFTAAKKKGKHVITLHSGNMGTAPFFPRFASPFLTERARVVRELFLELAPQYDIGYVDLFTEHKDDIFLTDVDNFYAADKLHLGPKGNLWWFKKIKEVIDERNIVIQ